jgi:hypothetical protein
MAEQQDVARRQSSSKRAKQKDTDREPNGNGGLATDVQELADYLVDRIKPGLNRGSIPLLARSIAKEIAHQDYRNGGSTNGKGDGDAEAEDEPKDEVEADDELEADDEEPSAEADDDVEADDESEEDDDDGEPSAGLETRLRDLQDELGEDWILYYAVQGDDAWLTAEKEDASQRIEASSADVLARAVKVLNEGKRS